MESDFFVCGILYFQLTAPWLFLSSGFGGEGCGGVYGHSWKLKVNKLLLLFEAVYKVNSRVVLKQFFLLNACDRL